MRCSNISDDQPTLYVQPVARLLRQTSPPWVELFPSQEAELSPSSLTSWLQVVQVVEKKDG
jgi:hypothetical protein